MKRLIYIIIVSVILSIMIGCKTKTVYVPVEKWKTEIEFLDRIERDSIHVQDSIFLLVKGDTVYKEKYKTIYKEKLVKDSIFIKDSIEVQVPYPVIEIKEVSRLKNWQIILMILGGVAIGYIGFKLIRYFRF